MEMLPYNGTLYNNGDGRVDNDTMGQSMDTNTTWCSVEYANSWTKLFPNEALLAVNMCLCCFGVIGNFLNIMTFTRKSMRNPTNTILLGISISDFIPLLICLPDYIARTPYFEEQYPLMEIVTYALTWYILSIFHLTSILATASLSIFRYIAVLHPLQSRRFCTMRRAKMIVLYIFLACSILCIPSFGAMRIIPNPNPSKTTSLVPSGNPRGYFGFCNPSFCAETSVLLDTDYGKFLRTYRMAYGGMCLILPCIIVPFLTVCLIRSLKRSVRTRSTYLNQRRHSMVVMPPDASEIRTTRILIAVLLLFLVTEAPVGVVCIAVAFMPPEFTTECLQPFGFLTLTVMQLSGTFNFLVYFAMSENFRSTLLQLICSVMGRGRKCGKMEAEPEQSTSTTT